MKQKTIREKFSLSGVGLHTGKNVEVTFKPAEDDYGLEFVRIDLDDKPTISVSVENVTVDQNVGRCTTLQSGEAKVHTIEHLMSAISMLGISNLIIEINGVEVPGMDGSAKEFVQAFQKAGIIEQTHNVQVFQIKEPIAVSSGEASIAVFPSDELGVSYTLDYPNSFLESKYVTFKNVYDSFEKEISPSRTFCLESEVQALQKAGLGQGANYQNTIVYGSKGPIENELRFEDESARHKVLDFLGDVSLLGHPIQGKVFAFKSGHALNVELLKKIAQQKKKYEDQGSICDLNELATDRTMDVHGIMKVIPHRYPFLFVDRILDIEPGKRAIGIKNVTSNDQFFTGHFPQRPVMPGVIMIEAMAQVAGVAVLTSPDHEGQLAFFMSIDNVKFRKVVVPGDQLLMEIEIIRDRKRSVQVHATAKVDGQIVTQADMGFSFTDASYLYG